MVGPLAEAAAKLNEISPRPQYADDGGHTGRYLVRVLEPSPPAVLTDPFADDPASVPQAEDGITRVGPVEGAFDLSWNELAASHPQIGPWCGERWLGAWQALAPIPGSFATARDQLHTLAEHVLTPAREQAVNRISLRWTRGGFGTPYLPGDVQLRIAVAADGVHIVRSEHAGDRSIRVTTAAAAAEFAEVPLGATGAHYKPLTTVDPQARLDIDPAGAAALASWFGFGTSVLEQLRHDLPPGADPGRVHLWPEHFDVAIEAGDESAGQRASVGASPGDPEHSEPYIYVAPWSRKSGGFWNDGAFGGASMSLPELAAIGDGTEQRGHALSFFRRGLAELAT
jgi:hypothetical protein